MTKDEAFARLGKSKFRSRFRLTTEDLAYIDRVGLATIRRHAEDFVRLKLAAAAEIICAKLAADSDISLLLPFKGGMWYNIKQLFEK